MAMEGIRGYLQLVSGLAEMSRTRAMEAASALLTVSGTVSSSVSSGVSGSLPGGGAGSLSSQVQELAEELLAAAAANRRSLVSLIRTEVENAVGRAALMPVDELDRARAAVAKLSADVEELREQVMASPAVRSIPEPGRSALTAMSGAVVGAASSVLGQRPQTAPRAQVTVPAGSPAARPERLETLLAQSTPDPPPAKRTTRKRATAKTSAATKSSRATDTSAAKTSSATKKAAKTSSAMKKAAKTSSATKKVAKTSSPTKKAAKTSSASFAPAKKATRKTATGASANPANPAKRAPRKTAKATATTATPTPTPTPTPTRTRTRTPRKRPSAARSGDGG